MVNDRRKNAHQRIACTKSSIQALTTAALILPGLLQSRAQAAEEDSVDFQYSHYQESKRDISGLAYDFKGGFYSTKLPNMLNPIEVDSIRGSGRFTLTDRIKFAFNYTQDTWSGATPISTAPLVSASNRVVFRYTKPDSSAGIIIGASPFARDQVQFFLDKSLNIYQSGGYDDTIGQEIPGSKNNTLVHTLGFASPETRKQGDFKLSYEWDEAAVDFGGGISVENDYESRFVNLGGRMDFNQKQTTLNLGLSYTNSDTAATLDPDGLQFFDTSKYNNSGIEFAGFDPDENEIYKVVPIKPLVSSGEVESTYQFRDNGQFSRTSAILRGNRQDWSTQLGLTQVLNKDAVLELGLGYTRSTGYLGNPYKLVSIVSAAGTPEQIQNNKLLGAGRYSTLEIRPDERNQFNWNLGYNQYIEPFDAALHFNYSFNLDDWGINAHTLESDWVQPLGAGWTITPRIRYYSQEAADFYQPIFTTTAKYFPEDYENHYRFGKLPDYFSSDHRLSGFGTLSGGITVSKEFAKGIRLETGIEYYTHQGNLKLGGGGEQDFADFDYWVANAALKVNLSSVGGGLTGGSSDHQNHHRHPNIPAGILYGHTLDKAGDMMAGYRYMHNWQAGHSLQGDSVVSEQQMLANSCPGSSRFDSVQQKLYFDGPCTALPQSMDMSMHILDLMYVPTDWLTLMLMPQFVDMQMNMYSPDSVAITGHSHGGDEGHDGHHPQTGGVGDTGMYALVKLFDNPQHHLHAGLGISAPSGDVGIKIKEYPGSYANRYNVDGAYTHYGMQLGSGTWDFKPSLTYTGKPGAWNWGAQLSGTKRLENQNASGYALGDLFETSVWGGYDLTHWLSATLRASYYWQGAIRHHYPTDRNNYFYICNKNDYIRTDDNNDDGIPDGSAYFHQSDYEDCLNNKRRIDSLDRPSPLDFSQNYGGQYVDIGFGVSATVPTGAFVGNRLAFEWLQPVYTNVNGYQLDRDGALSFTWSYGF